MDLIPLDKNESYWLLTPELFKICSGLRSKELSTYPDYATLYETISNYTNTALNQICINAGSDSLIESIARVLISPEGSILLPVPTFYGYENILQKTQKKIIPVYYTEQNKRFVFPLQETLDAMDTPNAAAIFLCHPNNPLGLSIPSNDLMLIIQKSQERNLLVVSDEAYFEYGGTTLLPMLQHMQNLIIIRTFSKAFGLSGARVGYSISSQDITEKLRTQMLPWPISHMSSFAVSAALQHKDLFKKRRNDYAKQRTLFTEMLMKLDTVTVYPSETNFLLIRIPEAERIKIILKENGIAVALGEPMSRYAPAQELLRSTLRIAIPSAEHIEKVVTTIRTAID